MMQIFINGVEVNLRNGLKIEIKIESEEENLPEEAEIVIIGGSLRIAPTIDSAGLLIRVDNSIIIGPWSNSNRASIEIISKNGVAVKEERSDVR